MSKVIYAAIGGENKKAVKLYGVVRATNRKIKRTYAAIKGENRLVYLAAFVWDIWNSVGTTAWNKYNTVEKTTYYWKRFGVKQEYGEWTMVFKENISEYWDSTTYNDTRFWGTLSASERYYDKKQGDMSIPSTAESKSYSQYGSYFEQTVIGKSVINGVEQNVYGWVRGGLDRTGSYKEYFNANDFVDIITRVDYDGASGSYYAQGKRFYKYFVRTATDIKDASKTYADASSESRSAYPDNGKSGSYWYEYSRSALTYEKGRTSYGTATSASSTTYPDNGRYAPDGYWYVKQGTTWAKGDTYYGEIEAENDSAYPVNGRHSDGRWYVRKE